MTDVRIERDCLGEMEIPNDQYYGIQTHRMEKVSGTANLPVIFYPDMHYALAQIKKAAAIANGKIGAMPAAVSKAIAQACDEMLTGKFNRKSSSEHSCQYGSVHQRYDSFCDSPRYDRSC